MNYGTMMTKAAKAQAPEYIPMVSVHLVREGRQKYSVSGPLNSPGVLYSQFAKMFRHRVQEKVVAVFVNTQLIPVGVQVAGIGTLNTCAIDIPGIFRAAILSGAAGLVLMHNHPSGDCAPSGEDIDVTKSMIKAGKLLNIRLLDHIIMTDDNYHSMREEEDVKF